MKKLLFVLCVCLVSGWAVAQPTLNLISDTYKSSWDEMSDIWGYTDPQGNEYAIATTSVGTSILDLSDPTNPQEIDFISGSYTYWRDAKTWGTYAYIVSETNNGLLIVDLSNLPNNVTYNVWGGDNFQGSNTNISSAHNIFIDENGIGYVCGGGNVSGVVMLDIASNPTNPEVVGIWNDRYVHDLFVKDDVMWTADIYSGLVSIVDVSTKSSPNVLNTIPSPYGVAHSTWLDESGQYLFVAEETGGAPISTYDISNVLNPILVDQFSHNSGAIAHNVFVKGNYLYISYYSAGVVALDISDPTNMTQIAQYDTSPASGSSFSGCWGVYPYTSNGLILANDIYEGFFVLEGEPVVTAQTSVVALKAYLEGAYNSSAGKMNTLLNGLIPLQQPYNVAPFNYAGTESLSNVPANMVDWVLVEAREGTPNLTGSRNTVTVETHAAILLDDGNIVSVDGTTDGIKFENLTLGNDYHFCIRHRNHLDVLTANALTLTPAVSYDFTTGVSMALGASQLKVASDNSSMLHAGDYIKDGVIQLTDFDFWRIEPALLDVYNQTDGNMDGVVQVTDYDTWVFNKAKLGIAEIEF